MNILLILHLETVSFHPLVSVFSFISMLSGTLTQNKVITDIITILGNALMKNLKLQPKLNNKACCLIFTLFCINISGLPPSHHHHHPPTQNRTRSIDFRWEFNSVKLHLYESVILWFCITFDFRSCKEQFVAKLCFHY